jgi:DNA-binding PadR family transcriptional regulator
MQKAPSDTDPKLSVNEYEGAVLGALARIEPATRYRLVKTFRESPTNSHSPSNGSLYPLVARLISRGMIESRPGSRRSEQLSLTEDGQRALAGWVAGTGPQHSIADDPLLQRVMSLGDLPTEEQVRWIVSAKALLLDKKDELQTNRSTAGGPYAEVVHSTAIAIVNTKLEWLDRLLIQIMNEGPEAPAPAP